jgi:TonB family protein
MLQKKAKSNFWLAPGRKNGLKTVVTLKVERDGAISRAAIKSSSGDSEYDQCALQAILDSSPLLPLPDGSPSDVDIDFEFDYLGYRSAALGNPIFKIDLALPKSPTFLPGNIHDLATGFME